MTGAGFVVADSCLYRCSRWSRSSRNGRQTWRSTGYVLGAASAHAVSSRRRCHICTGAGPTAATSAPGLGSPFPPPHLQREWALWSECAAVSASPGARFAHAAYAFAPPCRDAVLWVVRYVQGNMNSDNCLLSGRTMDYGAAPSRVRSFVGWFVGARLSRAKPSAAMPRACSHARACVCVFLCACV